MVAPSLHPAAPAAPLRVWAREEAMEEALAREIAPGAAVLLDRDLTWEELLSALAEPVSRPLDPLAARLALRGACEAAAAGTRYQAVAATRGFVSAAARYVAECERAGLEPSECERAARSVGPEVAAELQVLARVYARFAHVTEGLGAQPSRRRAIATRVLRSRAPTFLDGAAEVVVRPRHGWEPADVEAAVALAARVRALRVELPYAPGRPALAGGMEAIISAFEAHPQATTLELTLIDPAEAAPVLAPLFVEGKEAPTPATSEARPAALEVLVAPTPRAELRAVAARCRQRVDEGTPPEEIAVAARQPARVAGELAEELARVGLGLEDRRGPPLANAAPARLVLALLALPRRGFPREDTLAVLGSRYLGIAEAGSIARLARREGVRELAPGGAGLARLRAVGGHGARLADRVAAVVGAIAALPRSAEVSAHAHALSSLVDALGILAHARAIAEPGAGARVERAVARDQAAAQALAELLGRLPRAAAETGAAPASAASFALLLHDLMAETPLRSIGARGGAVKLVHLADLPGRSFAHLFLPGLVEGAAPARPADDGIWGERQRRALDRALGGRRLAVPAPPDEKTPFERLMLATALAAGQVSVTLSHPRQVAGRQEARSPFLDELIRAAPFVAITEIDGAPVPPLAEARAPADLLARTALEIYADPAGRLPGRSGPVRPAALYGAVVRALPARLARVARLARIERARWRFFAGLEPAGPHVGGLAGLVGTGALLGRVGGGPERPISAGMLERYANCPFTFLAARVLGVDPPEEGADEPDARDLGTLGHACLERFYGERLAAGALPLAGGPEDRRALEAACAAVFAETRSQHGSGHPVLSAIERERLVDDLQRLVAGEAERRLPGGGVPRFFELDFGAGRTLPAWEAAGLHVSGRIDRVDVSAGGDALFVVDYKLGRRAADRMRECDLAVHHLQLPIYAAAARAGLAARGDLRRGARADGALISIRLGTPTRSLAAVLGDEGLADLLDRRLPERVAGLAEGLRSGDFAVRSHDCRGCDYRTVCRVVSLAREEEEP